MRLSAFVLVVLLSHLSSAAHVDAVVVQIQRWGVVGAQNSAEQVLLNGNSLSSPSWEVIRIIESISTSALLPAGFSNDQNPALKNHTILRSRECIIEGSRLHWTDKVFCDGKVFLTLEQNNTWTVHVPEATVLREPGDQETVHPKMENSRLQEGCIQLMKELKFSEEQSDQKIPLPGFLIPILAVTAVLIQILLTMLICRGTGLRHPGGVIGSIIHYPKDIEYAAPEKKKQLQDSVTQRLTRTEQCTERIICISPANTRKLSKM